MLTRLPMPLLLVGLVTLYVAERTLEDTARWVVSGMAAALLILALVLAVLRVQSESRERRLVLRRTLLDYGLVLLAVLTYYAQSDVLGWISQGDAVVIAQVAWPALILLSVPSLVATDLALRSMQHGGILEGWRLKFAARSARIVALAIVAFSGTNFALTRWNKKFDLSYFQTAKPGTSNLKIVENITAPLEFVLFFPAGNDVLDAARTYLDTLAAASDQATVTVADQALEPNLARKYKVRSNGYLVVSSGSRDEKLRMGLDLEDARGSLRRFDDEMQKFLMRVLRPSRKVYFTTGHLERDYSPPADDKRLRMSDMRRLFEGLGMTVDRLGLGKGLGSRVPDDATLLVVVGPIEDFLPMELTAVHEYLAADGRILVMADPDHGTTLSALLEPLGLRVTPSLVAIDDARFTFRLPDERDTPYNVATGRASSHPSVENINRAAGRAGVALKGTGALEKIDQPPADLKITFTIRSESQGWLDLEANGKFDDSSEKRGTLELVAAVEGNFKRPGPPGPDEGASPSPEPVPKDEGEPKKGAPKKKEDTQQMRAIVMADADLASNLLLKNPGNAYLLVDAVRWLAGEDESIGTVESEADVAIIHRRDKDLVWFYGSSFMVPAIVLFGGLSYTRRTRRKRKSS